jgi:hypothetical protein
MAGGMGGWQPAKTLFCGWSLIAYTGIKFKNYTCVRIMNSMIPHLK